MEEPSLYGKSSQSQVLKRTDFKPTHMLLPPGKRKKEPFRAFTVSATSALSPLGLRVTDQQNTSVAIHHRPANSPLLERLAIQQREPEVQSPIRRSRRIEGKGPQVVAVGGGLRYRD